MKKQPIILVGGGGHCISCIDVIELEGKYNIIGILDLPEKVGQKILGYEIIGTDEQIKDYVKTCLYFLITVGQIKSAGIRKKIFNKIKEVDGSLPVITSPQAYVSKHATIDEGTIIMHHAVVNAYAKIGKCGIINSKALVEHEAIIGDFCHISTAACINGQVTIGANSFIGSNSTISNNISVAENTVIAADSQVLKNINESGTYIGNPLKRIR